MSVVTIVIPTRDRPLELGRTLGAVAALEGEPAPEVIVVDDGGSAALAGALAPIAEQMDLRVVRAGGAGPATARNLGAAEASGELLVFLDDDCAPRADWLARLLASPGVEGGMVAAGGRSANALTGNPYSSASQLIDDAVHTHFAASDGSTTFISSSNLLVGRAGFDAIGGYDQTFPVPGGEDRDFCLRWLEAGGELRLVPEAVVDHSHELDLRGFLRQHHSYGRGAWLTRRARAARGRGLMVSPSVGSGIFSDAIRATARRRDARAAALMVAWQLATLSGVAREALRPRRRAPAAAPTANVPD